MEANQKYIVNSGKSEFVQWQGRRFACYAIRTPVITALDVLEQVVRQYVVGVEKNDVVFFSEKMIACTQGRAIALENIRPGFWARILSKYVTQSDRGIGLSMPETMQCAINECGLWRILLASAAGLWGRIFHIKGCFYMVAGIKAAAVDGPCSYTLPPYNHYVVLAPDRPDKVAAEISAILGGNLALIIDANDFGCKILGASHKNVDKAAYEALLRQNPLGQSAQRTPIGVLRPLS